MVLISINKKNYKGVLTPMNIDSATFLHAMRFIGAGLAMIGAIGAGVGVGIAAAGGVQAMGRNPDATPIVQTNMILGMAFAEAVAIYALAVALIIIFAG
jgi:F-type H+-transporting ATPase subunit c